MPHRASLPAPMTDCDIVESEERRVDCISSSHVNSHGSWCLLVTWGEHWTMKWTVAWTVPAAASLQELTGVGLIKPE